MGRCSTSIFVEALMGLPNGWLMPSTGGNGLVPQCAREAWQQLTDRHRDRCMTATHAGGSHTRSGDW